MCLVSRLKIPTRRTLTTPGSFLSSGTGKTRTVIQLSYIRSGLLVCVRRSYRQTTSIPPRDDDVADILLAHANRVFGKTCIVATWLIALARELLLFYQKDYANFCNGIGGFANATVWSRWKQEEAELLKPRSAGTSHISSPPRPFATADSLTPREQPLRDVARTARGLSTADRYSYATHCSACRDLNIYPDEATSPAAFFKEDLSDAFQKLTTFVGGLPEYFHLAIDSCGIMQDRLQILRQLWSHTAGVVLFLLDNDAKIARFYDRHELDHPAKPGSASGDPSR